MSSTNGKNVPSDSIEGESRAAKRTKVEITNGDVESDSEDEFDNVPSKPEPVASGGDLYLDTVR